MSDLDGKPVTFDIFLDILPDFTVTLIAELH